MQRVEGRGGLNRAVTEAIHELLGRSVPLWFDRLGEGIGQQNGGVEVDHLPSTGALVGSPGPQGPAGLLVCKDALRALPAHTVEQSVH